MNKPKIDNTEFEQILDMTPEQVKCFREFFGLHPYALATLATPTVN